jgi:hypothetical protein
MANTKIQIKRSTGTATPTNGSLSAAEPAYSYSSEKLFLGTSDGTGVVEIGGKYWVDIANDALRIAQTSYTHANTLASSAYAEIIHEQANTARTHANAAYATANAGYTSSNAGYTTANSAYGTANGAYTNSNSAYDTANAGYTTANASYINSNSAYDTANAGYTVANAAFGVANNALPLAGGTVTGDLVVQGNVTFSGTTTYANTQTLLIGDNILTLNADLPDTVAPSEDAGFEINRGNASNVALLWDEGTDKWIFTNNGTSYLNIASNTDVETVGVSANTYAVSVGASANAWANTIGAASNTWANTVGTAGNNYTTSVGAAANAYTVSVGASGNAYTNTVGTAANSYSDSVGAAANTNAANATYLTTGTVPSGRISGSYTGITGVGTLTAGVWNASTVTVPYGGTGITSATTNGIIFGNGTSAFQVTSAGTDGQVLQANASGVPSFGHLDGGVF